MGAPREQKTPRLASSGVLDLVCGNAEGPINTEALVSAADLQASLDRIKIRSDELKEQIYETLTRHHHDILRIVNNAEQTTTKVNQISREVADAVKLLDGSEEEQGLGADIIASAAEYRVLQDETAAKQRALEAVALVSSLHQSLQALATQIHQGHLPLAAKSMLTLQERINGLPDNRAQDPSVKAPLVFGFLKDELSARNAELEAILDERFAKAVIVNQSRAEVRAEAALALPSRGHQPGSSAEGMWEALETLGLLDRKIEKLAEQLFSGPVTACLKSADVQIGASFLSLEEGEGTEVQRSGKAGHEVKRRSAKLKWVGGSNGDGSAPSLVEVYSQLLKVVQFLHQHVANEDRSKTLRLGTSLWPRIAKAIIEGPLTSAVPIEASKLPDFESFAEASRDFEKALEAAGFIPPSAEGHELSAFAADIDVHFAMKKRTSLLARARQLVLQPDWCYKTSTAGSATEEGPSTTTASASSAETPPTAAKKVKPLGRRGGVEAPGNADAAADVRSREASGEPQMPGTSGRRSDGAGANKGGPFFGLPTCQVSAAVQQLVQLAHEALQEATQSSERTVRELYRAARDVLQLYRAIVPVQRQHQLESVPQLAMVFHNDCLYIAHHMRMLGLQYRKGLPSNLRHVATFADLAPAFQQLAESTRFRQVWQQREELMRALDEGNGFRFTDEEANFKGAERAIKKVLHILGHLSAIWRPVLSSAVFSNIMTSLADASVTRVASEVLQLDDIAVEETTQLRHLLRTLLIGLPDVLGNTPAQPGAHDRDAGENLDIVSRLVPTAPKLLRLIDFLDMSLRDINAAWESGNLSACGFQAHEVQGLIRAIFSDTPLQREVLARIEASKARFCL